MWDLSSLIRLNQAPALKHGPLITGPPLNTTEG